MLWASFRGGGGAFDVVVFVVFWCENWVCQLLVGIIVAGMMASREQKRASCGRIKIAAFCAFILCSGLLLRLYELPGFANYHGHNNVDDGSSFVKKQDENQPAAEHQQQLAADHGLGVDLHHEEEEGEFTSSKIVKSKPTEDPSVARLTGSANDEDKGSLTKSQNALEMNETTLTSEEEADGDEMSGAEEAGDELELVPDKDDLVAADEEGGFQQDSDSRFSTNDDTERDDDAVASDSIVDGKDKPDDVVVDNSVVDVNYSNDSVLLPSNRSRVGDTRAASLRVHRMIQTYLAEYGVDRVKALPAEEFWERGATNVVYNVGGAQTPPKAAFGEYLDFSNQTFSMKEVRRLWAIHQCEHKYKRPLIMNIDRFELRTNHTKHIG
ncbi:unnamed protein product [Sphagnum tenellum]